MAIVRWDPGRDLDLLQSDVNRLFDAFFGARGTSRNGGPARWVPPMDLTEEENEYVLRADLPGLNEDDIEIEVKDDVLTISGERRYDHENRHEGFYRVERSFGSFSRTLDLPSGIGAEALRADFDRGVLEVHIPKPAQSTPTRVPIGAGAESEVEAQEDS
jgi:HSP20 family protein